MTRSTLAAAGALLMLAALPSASARAASAATEAFVANVRPNIDFLDRSSRLALDHTGRASVRAFAHEEALEQTVAANSLVAWTQTHTAGGIEVALGRPPVAGPLADLSVLAAPVAGVAGAAAEVVTGRSVAIDRPLTVSPAPVDAASKPSLLPAGAGDLSRLEALHGRGFDALYRTTQLDGLRQLSTLYRDYAAAGDDPALRALALRELPRINERIVALRRLR